MGGFLYSGLLLSRLNGMHMAKCDFHGDVHSNQREIDGANVNICSNQMVSMNYPNRN